MSLSVVGPRVLLRRLREVMAERGVGAVEVQAMENLEAAQAASIV